MIRRCVSLNLAITSIVLAVLAACGGTEPASTSTQIPTRPSAATSQATPVAPQTVAAEPANPRTPIHIQTLTPGLPVTEPLATAIRTHVPPATPTSTPVSTPTPTSTPVNTPALRPPLTPGANTVANVSEFLPGIYYGRPSLGEFAKVLMNLEGPLSPEIAYFSPGFDIRLDAVVVAGPNLKSVIRLDRGGKERRTSVSGIFQIVRPSFSPDGKRVAVQALESVEGSEDLNIYIIDLETGEAERISFLSVNEESPEWFHNENKIAYTSFSPEAGLNIHIYDVDAGQEISVFQQGAIHLAISPDDKLILNPQLVRIYDVATGNIVFDLKDKVMSALEPLGYKPDPRFPGQAGQGTFPLDADFSPDGGHIVFDGAVERDGAYGVVVFRMTITGDDLTPLTSLIELDLSGSSYHNYSQLNPSWLGSES